MNSIYEVILYFFRFKNSHNTTSFCLQKKDNFAGKIKELDGEGVSFWLKIIDPREGSDRSRRPIERLSNTAP